MNKRSFLFALIAFPFAFLSCKKDKTNSLKGDAVQLNNFFSTQIENNTQHFVVDATLGGILVGTKGTKIEISSNCLYNQNNQLVTGNVDVALVEIYDRASMVMMNKPTMGRLADGKMSTLISGGEYFLKITQNGQELNTNSSLKVSVYLPVNNTGGMNGNMSLFSGVIENNVLEWDQILDTVAVVNDSVWEQSYSILDGSWGWTNVDRFYSDPRPKTELKVKVPDGLNNTNCEVYLTYDGEVTALASLDVYTSDGYFSEHYGLIPIGLQVHFIAVTMIDGQLNYAIQAATITDGHIEYINSFTPISQANLATLINNLP